MKFIHITDLHLIEPGKLLWGKDVHAGVQDCLSDIAQWHADAEFCIITGDLTDLGEANAYGWLKQQLQALPVPCHLMIGNHDDRAVYLNCFAEQQRDGDGFAQSAFDTPAGKFLLLDTFKGGTSAGQYCARRQAWLRNELERAAGKPVWLFMHHPPFDIGIHYMDRIKLEEHQEFAAIVSDFPNIRHIFFGHVHRPVFVNWKGIACTALPALCHQIPLNRDAIGGKPYAKGPGMYGIVEIDGDQTTVHFEQFEDRGPADM
jgi:3',5'-cyclic AMP phosphodiesterase CpdA